MDGFLNTEVILVHTTGGTIFSTPGIIIGIILVLVAVHEYHIRRLEQSSIYDVLSENVSSFVIYGFYSSRRPYYLKKYNNSSHSAHSKTGGLHLLLYQVPRTYSYWLRTKVLLLTAVNNNNNNTAAVQPSVVAHVPTGVGLRLLQQISIFNYIIIYEKFNSPHMYACTRKK